MKFVQLTAGNAQGWKVSRVGASTLPFSHTMRRRLATLLVLTLALILPAASAHAADPLLSGYAGPGGGEQVVLGSTTLKTTNKASTASTSGSSSGQDDAGNASLKADTSNASTSSSASSGESGGASSTLTRKPQRKKSSSSTSKDAGDDAKTTTTTGGSTTTATTPATLPGAPEVVAYPTRAGEVSGLPVSAAGLLLIVIGVAAATLLGLGLRRISGSDDPQDPQVSAS